MAKRKGGKKILTEQTNQSTEAVNEVELTSAAQTETLQNNAVSGDHDDFDWSMDNEGFANYSKDERKKLEDSYKQSFTTLNEHEVVKGKIVAIGSKDIIINVGFKSDGIISKNEFRDVPDFKVGDEIDVYVLTTEDSNGQLVLSRKKAIQEGAWGDVVKAMNDDMIVTGHVKSRTKGGLVVEVLGIDCFLPGSQIDIKPVRDFDIYVGKDMQFKIVKVNELYKNVVISHKALIEDDIQTQKTEMIKTLEKGQVLEGVVKNMTSFGVFVDLGGMDGLLHITDISWGRINHPEEVLKLEDKINVVVLDFDHEKNRISLGMKQLTDHPWAASISEYKEGDKVKGKVVAVSDYGAFIEIKPGVEGLIHVSEMSWSQHLRNPQEFMKVGDEVEAVILAIDNDEHKMSLGIKQLTSDPWVDIAAKYPLGSKHKGVVKNLTNYGLFVELAEGVDGLVHVSDLSWNKKVKHPADFVKKGEELEVVVLEVDNESRRLSLGHKQLEENPWDTFESIFFVDSLHNGTITSINDKGANVQLQYGVEGFCPTRHLKKQDKTTPKEDEILNFEVIEFNKETKRIILSHTNLWKREERENAENAEIEKSNSAKRTSSDVKRINQSIEKDTLGDNDALQALKAKMFEGKVETKKDTSKKETKSSKSELSEEIQNELKSKLVSNIGANEDGKKDDLKLISGIGPVFETKLNSLGVYTFEQLTKLNAEGIDALEQLTKFPGRIEREDWIGQAKKLMNGENPA